LETSVSSDMGSPFDGEGFTGLCVGIDRFARWDV
jgi:hypothetical protein